jgi:hypothetical protein
MNAGIGARLKRIAKVLATLVVIELCLPGGTLIVLGYLLALRPHVRPMAEGERALTAWRGLRGLLSANTTGESSRADARRTGSVEANRRAAWEGPPVIGES